jgi:hypothetical protein
MNLVVFIQWLGSAGWNVNYWFEEHGDIVKRRYCVCDYVFESLERVISLSCFSHEIRVHATRHCWVLEGGSWDHCFDGESYSGKI